MRYRALIAFRKGEIIERHRGSRRIGGSRISSERLFDRIPSCQGTARTRRIFSVGTPGHRAGAVQHDHHVQWNRVDTHGGGTAIGFAGKAEVYSVIGIALHEVAGCRTQMHRCRVRTRIIIISVPSGTGVLILMLVQRGGSSRTETVPHRSRVQIQVTVGRSRKRVIATNCPFTDILHGGNERGRITRIGDIGGTRSAIGRNGIQIGHQSHTNHVGFDGLGVESNGCVAG